MMVSSSLSGLSGRGPASGPSNEAGASPQPPQGLSWGYGGVDISPMAVPAPDVVCLHADAKKEVL